MIMIHSRFGQIQRYNWFRAVFMTRRYVAITEGKIQPKSFDAIPRPSPIVNLVHFIRNGGFKNISNIQKKKFEKFGPIFAEQVGRQCNVNILRPDDFATVFRQELGKFPVRYFVDLSLLEDSAIYSLNGNDESRWRESRETIGKPLLVPREVKRLSRGLDAVAQDLTLKLEREQKNGMLHTLTSDIVGYTTESICNLVYGRRLGFFEPPPKDQQIKEFIKETVYFSNITFEISSGFKIRKKLIAKKYERARNRIRLISGNFSKSSMDRNDDCLYNHMLERGKSEEFIRDTAVALCQAGVETTSTSLLWCLYDLSRNPAIQEKAYQEIVSVIGPMSDNLRKVDPNYYEKLPYLKGCVRESLRLHPIVSVLARTIQEDAVLSGYHVPANTTVVMWNSLVSYSEDAFHHANQMNPERWLRDSCDEDVLPFTFLPFGFGTRACLGRRFAMPEMLVALARIIQRFQLKYNGEDELCQVIKAGIGFPEKEILIKVNRRPTMNETLFI